MLPRWVFIIFAACVLSWAQAFAAGFLEVVKSTTTEANFILYNNSAAAIQRYKKAIWQNPSLKNFVPVQELDYSLGKLQTEKHLRPRVLLLANSSVSDVDRHRLELAFIRPFIKKNAEVYMLPIAPALGLSPAEKAEFFDLLSEHFDLMIANGGDDVHPNLYDEVVTHSVDINEARDRAESEVIKSYIERGRGFFYGVCRGMQLAAVSFGMKMYQDIPKEVGEKVAHGGSGFRYHDISLKKTKNSILQKMVGGQEVINGFSWHHQAVKFSANSVFELAGTDIEDQFPEALESKNGKALLTQFHPEHSRRVDSLGQGDSGSWGVQILDGLFERAKMLSSSRLIRSCHQVLSSGFEARAKSF